MLNFHRISKIVESFLWQILKKKRGKKELLPAELQSFENKHSAELTPTFDDIRINY